MPSGSAAWPSASVAPGASGAIPEGISRAVWAVWPGARHVGLVLAPSPPSSAHQEYVALPSLRQPRWLLPTTAAVPAESLTAPGSGIGKRLGLAMLSAALRTGLGPWLPVRKVRVDLGGGQSLVHVLGAVVGEQNLTVAIRLGHWRAPRAVVLRMFSPSGATLGFAKLSLDPAGRASVRAEVSGLALARSLRLSLVEAPTIWHRGQWHDQELLVTSPLSAGYGTDPMRSMPLAAMAELARAGGTHVDYLARSGWCAATVRRIGRVDDQGMRRRFESVIETIVAAERRSGTGLPLGRWHGDWTPWNMAQHGARVLLWDWEHAAEDVPVGFDHVHFLAQRLRVSAGSNTQVERRWVREAADVLRGEVGLGERQQVLLILAYLLEVNVRYVLDRQATSQYQEPRTGWGLDLLESQACRALGGARNLDE